MKHVHLGACLCLLQACLTLAADPLHEAFLQPPHSAKPWVYWFWMDGNLSREGITADLEAMQRAGIGGMIIMEVDVGIPRGPVQFMSPPWRALFKHAVLEAERLNLQITLNAGPGWTGSGGPWVKPEQSMQHLVAGETNLAGGVRFTGKLPLPPVKAGFYRDVAVLAFPTPAADYRIPDIVEKALYDRQPYSSQPNVKAYLPAPADFPAIPAGATIPRTAILDLSTNLAPSGELSWDVPPGNWTVLRLGCTSTGANTRPAPEPGIGLESDKFDRAALEAHYADFVGSLLKEIGPRPANRTNGWTMLHIDSWEMGAQNWTGRFRDEFQRRRGYDPLLFLPAFTGRVVEDLAVSERFLWDVRQTSQELVIENHAQHLKALGRRDGFGLSIEPYDMNPCSDLSLGGVADVPMCEFWSYGYGFNTAFSCIESVSIAHTLGRPIVAAEAFTADAPEAWRLHPGNMKAQADWAFCTGINRLVFHRYAHQPWLDRWPGMTMGPYGVHYERTQTWWDMVPAWHTYLARCQFMLRQGLPVADICYLAPEGAPHVFRPPASAVSGPAALPDRKGYNFDACAPETLLHHMSVENGRLTLPHGMSYRVLILPEMETMTPPLLRKIHSLVEQGATVIGPRPRRSPSLAGYPNCDDAVRQLAAQLWGDNPENTVGRGKVIRTSARPAAPVAPEPPRLPPTARWIWHREGSPAQAAPVGTRWFRRIFTLDPSQNLDSAQIVLTADNSFRIEVNGQLAGEGDSFKQAYAFDLKPLLRPGTNVITVTAENGGSTPNPAGLIGALNIVLSGGRSLNLYTDARWQSTAATNEPWQPAMDLGPYGMPPWGETGKTSTTPPPPPLYTEYPFVADVLARSGVSPDFETDAPLRYIHRRTADTDLYYVANTASTSLVARCAFRVSGKKAALWDPVTGRTHAISGTDANGRTQLSILFTPYASWFVVFRPSSSPLPGNSLSPQPQVRPVMELADSWEVEFQPRRGAPEKASFETLADWSHHTNQGIKFFSGIATYRKTFDLPNPLPAQLHLDLGQVEVIAHVKLNGQDLGVLWHTPFRVPLGTAARPGPNTLEIQIANLWPNRLIGDQSLAKDQRVAWTTWHPYQKNSKLLPSGLLGPVQLLTAEP